MGLAYLGELVGLVKAKVDRRPTVTAEQLRTARPLQNPSVEFELADDGSVLLVAPMDSTGRGFSSTVAKWMKVPPTKKFELEPIGGFVWTLCDGKTNFETMSKALRERYKMNRVEADASLLAFLQMLSQRKLITMMVNKSR